VPNVNWVGRRRQELRYRYLSVETSLLACARMAWAKILGRDVWYINPPPGHSLRSRFLTRIGARLFELEKCESIVMAPESYAAPSRSATTLATRLVDSCIVGDFQFESWPVSSLRIELARTFSQNFELLTIVDCWARQWTGSNKAVRVPNRRMATVLRLMETPATVLPRALSATPGFQNTRNGCLDLVVGYSERVDTSSDHSPHKDSQVRCLLVLNHDIRYGQLYSYEELLPKCAASDWALPRVGLLSRRGGILANGFKAYAYPSPQPQWRIALSSVHLMARLTLKPQCFSTRWRAHVLRVRATHAAKEVRTLFPFAKAALLAFDIQIPPYLVLGLEMAGIETVALQERPALAFDGAATTFAGSLLAASDRFSIELQRSGIACAKRYVTVGMWRTDLLLEAIRESRREDSLGPKTVLALPYHAESTSGRPSDPICTSVESLLSFLDDIESLALKFRDSHFVIRAKNDRWLHDQRTSVKRERLRALGNVSLDDDYSDPNRSYWLAARSDLIVAKPTSLVDEALACGIPCIIHDFTHNVFQYARPLLTHFPRELWASNPDDLSAKVGAVLADPQAFLDPLEPFRRSLYGEWADGLVRSRIQSYLESIIA